jgi:pimeloyl-ACP methyl ester carboxylesterase
VNAAPKDAATFVLIHGAWHGGWCFDRLSSSLEVRGHTSIAMDLPIEDGTATFHDYAQVVINAMPHTTDNVVLVGHSLGAMTLPLIAAQYPVRVLVFLCGVVPRPGGSPWDDGPEMTVPGILDALVTHDDGSTSVPFDTARDAFYSDCSVEDAKQASDRLRRQNSSSLWQEPYPVVNLPPITQVSIVGTRDRLVTLPWSRHVASTRLGVDPIELPVAHSPFLSHPDLLADTLIEHLP